MHCVSDAVLVSGAAILWVKYLWAIATAKPALQPTRGLKYKQYQPGWSILHTLV